MEMTTNKKKMKTEEKGQKKGPSHVSSKKLTSSCRHWSSDISFIKEADFSRFFFLYQHFGSQKHETFIYWKSNIGADVKINKSYIKYAAKLCYIKKSHLSIPNTKKLWNPRPEIYLKSKLWKTRDGRGKNKEINKQKKKINKNKKRLHILHYRHT